MLVMSGVKGARNYHDECDGLCPSRARREARRAPAVVRVLGDKAGVVAADAGHARAGRLRDHKHNGRRAAWIQRAIEGGHIVCKRAECSDDAAGFFEYGKLVDGG